LRKETVQDKRSAISKPNGKWAYGVSPIWHIPGTTGCTLYMYCDGESVRKTGQEEEVAVNPLESISGVNPWNVRGIWGSGRVADHSILVSDHCQTMSRNRPGLDLHQKSCCLAAAAVFHGGVIDLCKLLGWATSACMTHHVLTI
jgi:hypothetical protein